MNQLCYLWILITIIVKGVYMRALNPQDRDSLQEIADIHVKINTLIEHAKLQEKNYLWFEAEESYREAQHLSYHVGEGLQVKIINEQSDLENWHRLNKKIDELKIKLSHLYSHLRSS